MTKKTTPKKKKEITTSAIPHADAIHVSSDCIRTYFIKNDGSSLSVTTTLLSNAGTVPRPYRVVIRRAPGITTSLPFSLFALGIQGRRWEVDIVKVTGVNVTFTEWATPPTPVVVSGIEQSVKKTLPAVEPTGSGHLDENRLWFVSFTGELCELKIDSHRPKRPKSPKIVHSHDVAPPPPEGGGDDGEEQ